MAIYIKTKHKNVLKHSGAAQESKDNEKTILIHALVYRGVLAEQVYPDTASHLKQVKTCLLWAACKEGQDGHQMTLWIYQDPLGKEARSPKDNQPAPGNHKSTLEPLQTVAGINNRCFLVHIFWCQTIISMWALSGFEQCQIACGTKSQSTN